LFKLNCSTSVKKDGVEKMVNELLELTHKRVLVGVKESENMRPDEVGNAQLVQIHEFGSPLQNIPARPFIAPGIARVQDKVNDGLFEVAKAQLEGRDKDVDLHLNRVGLMAQNSIRSTLTEGAVFAPLSERTKLARLSKRKASEKWSGAKRAEVMESFKPLIDTGTLRRSIGYAIEETK